MSTSTLEPPTPRARNVAGVGAADGFQRHGVDEGATVDFAGVVSEAAKANGSFGALYDGATEALEDLKMWLNRTSVSSIGAGGPPAKNGKGVDGADFAVGVEADCCACAVVWAGAADAAVAWFISTFFNLAKISAFI